MIKSQLEKREKIDKYIFVLEQTIKDCLKYKYYLMAINDSSVAKEIQNYRNVYENFNGFFMDFTMSVQRLFVLNAYSLLNEKTTINNFKEEVSIFSFYNLLNKYYLDQNKKLEIKKRFEMVSNKELSQLQELRHKFIAHKDIYGDEQQVVLSKYFDSVDNAIIKFDELLNFFNGKSILPQLLHHNIRTQCKKRMDSIFEAVQKEIKWN